MKRDNQNLDKYSMLTKQILALYFSGCYITNKEFQQIGKNIGIEVDLSDRETVFKKILSLAVKNEKEVEFFNEILKLLKKRFNEYSNLAQDFPNSSDVIKEWMQKLRSIDLLIKQKIRMNPYE
ncbi:hypothetical protein [Nitrosophilus labii]|uniref:hypothetical protein n=1 Tax=Nitrosophilus labii TaxID=2706014 RepID=UPI001656F703|nr:hypothetical protein [Nitrosophilus labii]